MPKKTEQNGLGTWLKNGVLTVSLLTVLLTAAWAFDRKVDDCELKEVCKDVNSKIEKGDSILHKRIDKTEERLLVLIANNQKEIIELLKRPNK